MRLFGLHLNPARPPRVTGYVRSQAESMRMENAVKEEWSPNLLRLDKKHPNMTTMKMISLMMIVCDTPDPPAAYTAAGARATGGGMEVPTLSFPVFFQIVTSKTASWPSDVWKQYNYTTRLTRKPGYERLRRRTWTKVLPARWGQINFRLFFIPAKRCHLNNVENWKVEIGITHEVWFAALLLKEDATASSLKSNATSFRLSFLLATPSFPYTC